MNKQGKICHSFAVVEIVEEIQGTFCLIPYVRALKKKKSARPIAA